LHDLAEEKHKECRDERRMRHEDTLPRPAMARRLSMGLKAAVAMGGRSGWQMQNKEQFGKFRIQLRGFM